MIQRTIHYCWLSGDPYPELIKKCINSWKLHLSGYQFVLWDLKKVNTIHNQWLEQTIASKKYAFAADYIRLYALVHYGGIYLDADVELVGSLDPFLKHDLFIGCEYNNDLEPAILGAVKDHPWLTELLSYYLGRSFIKKNGDKDTKPLPTIFNESAIQRFHFVANGKLQLINNENIVIYPCDYFSPKNIYFKHIKTTSNTVAIHHFDSSWVEKNAKYRLKQAFHQVLYHLGGKSFHTRIVQIIRKISRYSIHQNRPKLRNKA